MHPKSLLRRRPSPAMLVGVVAVFFALGGVGWAATQLAPNSVGTAQIKNGAVTTAKIRGNAVTFQKIAPGTIGIRRINPDMIQARVSGACSDTAAIGSINRSGGVKCNSTAPMEFGTSSAAVPVGAASTTVTSKSLAAGTYLMFAGPYASITNSSSSTPPIATQIQVNCTLAVPGGVSQSRSVIVLPGGPAAHQQLAFPLALPATIGSKGATVTLNCNQVSTPASKIATVTVTSTINAIQTASNS
jgi:hypothetical protein